MKKLVKFSGKDREFDTETLKNWINGYFVEDK